MQPPLYVRVEGDGHHNKKGHDVNHEAEDLGHLWLPPFRSANRVNHSQVAIDAHRRQAEGGGELAHGVDGHAQLAEEIPIWPVGEQTIGAKEGNSHDVESIRQG